MNEAIKIIEQIEIFKNSFKVVGRVPNLNDIDSLIRILKEQFAETKEEVKEDAN